MIGLLGRKVGMTRVFTEEGKSIPVTVISVLPNRVSQIKTIDSDGYCALQLTAGHKKQNRVNKPLSGHFSKASIEAGDMISEFRIDADMLSTYALGQEIKIEDVFAENKKVDVSSTSKGKGFAGTVKRHNFRTQDATHGNSRSHRVPGSIGQNQSPGRVFKGKKMCGQMGNKSCSVLALEVVRIDSDRNIMLVKGGIPGAPGTKVRIRPSLKMNSGGK